MSNEERREFIRAFFSADENIKATVQTHGESQISITASLISISGGGLSFFCSRENVLDIIKKGDQLTVTDLHTPPPLGPIASFGVEVRYILNHKDIDRIGFGCKFNKISDALRNKIENFVEFRVSKKGNKGK